ncbi:MAG: flagellar motor switch phosphatase FliY [Lachnospiraceae bacterium]|nr:flagellar motor switch phosphatase FliY [Lachnospiraceae bacterium]
MDGMLSQDEINALLNGMTDNSDGGGTDKPADTGGIDEDLLTAEERDAIGEVANISMGSSATTLYSLVNRKVNITTPTVSLANWSTMLATYEKPCVFIQIKYTTGLDGSNILILKEQDVKIITDLMMGGDGTNIEGEIGELQLSAISEAMNQMMGSSATSMSSMLGKLIDISPPEASRIDLSEKNPADIASFLTGTFVKIEFRMQIDDLVDSTILQLYPIDFAKSLYDIFIGNMAGASTQSAAPEPQPQAAQTAGNAPQPEAAPQAAQVYAQMPQMGMPQMAMPQMGMPQMGMPQMGMPQMGMAPQGYGQMQGMDIQPAQFQNFSTGFNPMQSQENIGLIMDVPLEVTVELGRTKKSISEILDFAPGTIIELDKIAGEPVDVLVNGKLVAKGEVVVIEESFGVRVTEIIK